MLSSGPYLAAAFFRELPRKHGVALFRTDLVGELLFRVERRLTRGAEIAVVALQPRQHQPAFAGEHREGAIALDLLADPQ